VNVWEVLLNTEISECYRTVSSPIHLVTARLDTLIASTVSLLGRINMRIRLFYRWVLIY
jgi:hypothetical protein